MSFWTRTMRKRRNAHRCATCHQIVPAGEKSLDHAGVYEGDFSSFKQCRACDDIARYFFWRGTFEWDGYQLDELADYSMQEGLIWPPVWNYVAGEAGP